MTDHTDQPLAPFDPKLKAAMAEIRLILARYDVGGMVVLASGSGHTEYMNYTCEPTWSCLRVAPPGLRFTAKVRTGPESERMKAARTGNMIQTIKDTLEHNLEMYRKVNAMIHEHTAIEFGEGRFIHE